MADFSAAGPRDRYGCKKARTVLFETRCPLQELVPGIACYLLDLVDDSSVDFAVALLGLLSLWCDALDDGFRSFPLGEGAVVVEIALLRTEVGRYG